MKTFEYKGRRIGVDKSITNNVEYWWAEWKPSNGDQTHTTRRCKDMDEAITQAKQAIDSHPVRNGTGKAGKVLFAICVVVIIAICFEGIVRDARVASNPAYFARYAGGALLRA